MVSIYSFFLLSFFSIILSFSSKSYADAKIPQSYKQIQLSFAPLVKKALPAVVGVYTEKQVKVIHQPSHSPFFQEDPFFNQFFEQFPFKEKEQIKKNSAFGSGVLISKDGFIITNFHVVENSVKIKVKLSDRREFIAKVVGHDSSTDLALLKIKKAKKDFPYLKFGNSDSIEIGDLVVVIGNPYGFSHSVSSGIISGLERNNLRLRDYESYIQTDAAINPGNSGGAMVNMKGELIGIPSAIYTKGHSGFIGIGWAIPSKLAQSVYNSITTYGQIIRPVLGIAAQPITDKISKKRGIEKPEGILITAIRPNSPADKSNLKEGDIILKINGHPIHNTKALKYRLSTIKDPSKVRLSLLKGNTLKEHIVNLDPLYKFPDIQGKKTNTKSSLQGSLIADLSTELAKELRLNTSKGVVILDVEKNSKSEILGLKAGDIIHSIDLKKIKKIDDVDKYLNQNKRQKLLKVKRGRHILKGRIN